MLRSCTVGFVISALRGYALCAFISVGYLRDDDEKHKECDAGPLRELLGLKKLKLSKFSLK
jgi:hypothetical protein